MKGTLIEEADKKHPTSEIELMDSLWGGRKTDTWKAMD